MTEIASSADADVVDRVVAELEGGGTVVLPTDTVYGLAASADRADATERLFELKGRAVSVPIAVLCATTDQALGLAQDPRGQAARLAAAFWPGPLTLVLPRRSGIALHLGEPTDTIGLRVPDHPLIAAIASLVGPIATTSANPHGMPTPATAAEVISALGPGIAFAVDGGTLEGFASTVVDLTTEPWDVRREGAISESEIARHLA